MKTKFIALPLLGLGAILLSGCTTGTPTASTRPTLTTEKKVYSKAELDKRGRQTPGEALAAQDEQVTISQGRGH